MHMFEGLFGQCGHFGIIWVTFGAIWAPNFGDFWDNLWHSGLVWSQIHQKDQGFNNVGPGLLFSWSAMQRIAMLQSFEPLQILMLFKQSSTHWKLINLLSLDGKQEKMISRLAARWSETVRQLLKWGLQCYQPLDPPLLYTRFLAYCCLTWDPTVRAQFSWN